MSATITRLWQKIKSRSYFGGSINYSFWLKLAAGVLLMGVPTIVWLKKSFLRHKPIDNPSLSQRCRLLREKIEANGGPNNAALVFTVTRDIIYEQSQIPFVCQQWLPYVKNRNVEANKQDRSYLARMMRFFGAGKNQEVIRLDSLSSDGRKT